MSVPDPAADAFVLPLPAGTAAAALRPLYDALAPRLLGVCARLSGDRAQAEEAVADAFALAARHGTEGEAAAVWLCVVARGRVLARRRAADPAPGADAEPDPVIPAEPSQGLRRLEAALAELTPMQAASLRAAYLDGADYPELARRAAVPLGTLKSGLRRGLLRLQERLDA